MRWVLYPLAVLLGLLVWGAVVVDGHDTRTAASTVRRLVGFTFTTNELFWLAEIGRAHV